MIEQVDEETRILRQIETDPEKIAEWVRKCEALLAQLDAWIPIGSSHAYETKKKGLQNAIWSAEHNKKFYGYYMLCYYASRAYFMDQKELKLRSLKP